LTSSEVAAKVRSRAGVPFRPRQEVVPSCGRWTRYPPLPG